MDRIEYGDITDAGDREFIKQISPLTHVEVDCWSRIID